MQQRKNPRLAAKFERKGMSASMGGYQIAQETDTRSGSTEGCVKGLIVSITPNRLNLDEVPTGLRVSRMTARSCKVSLPLFLTIKGASMLIEKVEVELTRLRTEQAKSQQDEVFGGFSLAERAQFDARTNRINRLELSLSQGRS
ncbi:MAG: hypothetical protein JWQ87_5207 [Candidatus Sulfotelmatobacter sp.]|nr:hypothetical protein [Candidatus Sulfotelmatobacter sp.]